MADLGRRRPPEPLTGREVQALVRVVGRGRLASRNAALILTMYEGGLRVSEALDLELRDLDLDAGSIRVRHGKGDRDRVTTVGTAGEGMIRHWLRERATHGHHATWVFCTMSGQRLHASYVRQMLPRLARRAGIEKRVHAHGLRHGYALNAVRQGIDAAELRDRLGHANLATTDRYLRRIAPNLERMRAAADAAYCDNDVIE